MIATTSVRETTLVSADRRWGNVLAGTGTLTRHIIRCDRIKLAGWMLGMVALLTFFASVVSGLTETAAQREDLRRFMDGATGAIMGPGYGRFDITAERYIAGTYGLFFFILSALMSMQLVARNTRGEEQAGRAEMLRSSVVGRHAPLTAALIVAAGANVVLALTLGGTMAANGFDVGNGLLFGASVGAVGLVFAGIAAVAGQVTENSRAVTGITGAMLGVAWVIRAAGDMIRDFGSPLSWFSPLAWSNQTRPYVDGRWWPLLLSVGLAVTAAAVGYVLSARRDIGEGLIPARPGAPVAARWLRSPFAVAFRLQRDSLMWWTIALVAFGLVLGGLGDQIADPEDMSESRIEMFGGSVDTLLAGYLGMMAQFLAVLACIMMVRGVQAARSEETEGRADPVLATATSRWAWYGSYLAVMAMGLVGLLLMTGLATGIGAAVSVGDNALIRDMVEAYLSHVPGVLVMFGVAAILYGMLPRVIGASWILVGYSLFVGLFGTTIDVPRWARGLSPMEHTGRPPLDSISWPPMMILLFIAGGLMAAGLIGFRHRDLETK